MENAPKKLRIAMIGLKGIPVGEDAGGIERHVEELAVRLAAAGHDVSCYVRPGAAAGRATYRGVRLIGVPSVPTKLLDAFTRALFSTVAALTRPADVVHYHGVGPATFAWIPRVFKPGCKVVVTFHSIDRYHQKWGALARAYLRYGEWSAVRFPHATIAVSQTIRDYCARTYGASAVYIPNGAVVRAYPGDDELAKWGLRKDGYILTVSRLVRQKGIHHLIKAYDGFEKEKTLVIVGAAAFGTDYADEVRRLSEGNSSIVFTGFQKGRALAQLFANAYLYVHPSEAEGLSVSILEAMGAGRCALVSDIPENVESIDHSGLTFANADAVDLRVKLRELLNHPEVVAERGAKARAWVKATYDWDVIAAKTAALYDDLVSKKMLE